MQNPLTLVIFGATGDLYQSKLAPSLFNMFSTGLLPNDLNIIGFARKPLTDSDFQDLTKDAIFLKNKNPETKKIQDFLSCLKYIRGDLENLESFKSLGEKLSAEDYKKGFCTNKLFYLAVPPSLYEVIFKNIALAGLTVPCAPDVSDKEEKWTRVLVEKPFGKDIKDAERLDAMLGELFDESQIFRIDHYMAKEILQNILTFRFSNSSLEPTWNKENIEKIRIIFHYAKTVEKRGSFFDGVGMLRDVGQNHMLQMLALIAMEDPSKSNGEIHRVRQKVLEKTKLVSEAEIIRGQYEGYLMENGVKSDSNTETFFCFFFINFYLISFCFFARRILSAPCQARDSFLSTFLYSLSSHLYLSPLCLLYSIFRKNFLEFLRNKIRPRQAQQ